MKRFFKLSIVTIILLSFVACTPIKFNRAPYYHVTALDMEPMRMKRPNIALVLGGGGAKGLAHVGVIEELEKAGYKPDLIVGSSAGAIVGAMYAENGDLEHVKELLLRSNRSDVLSPGVRNFPYSLDSGETMEKFLSAAIKTSNIEKFKIPFIAVTTNLENGKMVTFGRGPYLSAVRASAAVPGALYPVRIDGQYYVDGCVADPVPVQVAKRYRPKLIIAVDIGEELTDAEPSHMLGVMKRSLEISYIHQSKMAAKDADIIIDVPFKDVGMFNDAVNEMLYHSGRDAARDAIKESKHKLARYRKSL